MLPHDNGESAIGQATLEDRNLDIDEPILRERTYKEIGYPIERVPNARCSASIAIGLRRGRDCPGWANVFMSCWPSVSETKTQAPAPVGNARRASASNASRLSSSNAGERDNASRRATYLPSSASTAAAIDRAA